MTKKTQLPKQSDAYWKKRIAKEREYMERATDVSDLEKYYQQAIDDIQEKIDAEYARLDHLGFEVTDVKQVDIRNYEREAAEVVRLADRIRKKLKRNARKSDYPQAVNDRMTVYNATMRINRLEYLKSRTALSLLKAGVQLNDALTTELIEKGMNEYKRQAGILGQNVSDVDLKKNLNHVLAQVKSADFSERIWENTDKLKAELDVLLTENRIRGQNPRVIARRLRGLVASSFADQAKYITERLARTESTRSIISAQLDSYKESGFTRVKWIAESNACGLCKDLSRGGKNRDGVYEIDNAPSIPAHPNCRCSFISYYDSSEDM